MGGKATALAGAERALGTAVDAFLAQPRPATTARTYTRTLDRLAQLLGADRPLADLTNEELAEAVTALWGQRSAATWNRNVATVRSFLAWCRRHGWPVGDLALRVDRRPVPDDDTKVIPLAELERLWSRADVPVRERAFWRLCYDTAGRAEEILGLDVGDIDLANRTAIARTKGGHRQRLHFQTAAARQLAKLLKGRERGPVFLTHRRPGPGRAPAAGDVDPVSGRARLSYEQAEQLFKRYSGGKHLHQLRHSRLTHLGDAGVPAPVLQAISGHKRLSSLQPYVKVSDDAVARVLAELDPDRR